jgi:hypothetical protein
MVNVIQAQMPAGAAIRPEQAHLLQCEVLNQCDAADGLIAPCDCKFDARKLACGVSYSPQALTPSVRSARRRPANSPSEVSVRRYGSASRPTHDL